MEEEIVTSAAETAMSIEPPCSRPPASQQSIFEQESIVEPQAESAALTDATVTKSDNEEEEEDLEQTAVETLHCRGGGQNEKGALFKSPTRPEIPSSATLSAPLDSPVGSQLAAPANPLLGSLSPASLSLSGSTPPRSIYRLYL